MKNLLKVILAAIVLTFLTGCLPVLVGGLIYNSTAKREAFSKYVTESQKNNTDREVKGLKPLAIMTFDQWEKGQIDTPGETLGK